MCGLSVRHRRGDSVDKWNFGRKAIAGLLWTGAILLAWTVLGVEFSDLPAWKIVVAAVLTLLAEELGK